MRLSGHVRFDDLVGDVAATAAQGASRPHIATPKALPPLGKFGQQTLGALVWHPLDQATAGDVRRDGDHHVAMIRRDMSLQDIDPRFLTCFADKSADPFCTLTTQCFIAILRNPDDRHVDRESRMGAMAIVTHAPESIENLLKLPPKDGGFNPSNWRQ